MYDMQLMDAYIDELISDFDSSSSDVIASTKSTGVRTVNALTSQKNNRNKKFAVCFCLVCAGITIWILSHLWNSNSNYVHSTTEPTLYSAVTSLETEKEKTYYRVGPPTTANQVDDGTDVDEYFSSSSNDYDVDSYDMFLDNDEEMVWISTKGKRYHSNASCSNMTDPDEVPLSEAEDMGYTPCKKCY